MHVLGKVFLGLLLVTWAAGLYFSVGVVKIRSAWLEKIQDEQDKIVDLNKKIAEESKLRRDKEAELELALFGWGHVWNGVFNEKPDPATGTFRIRNQDGNKSPIVLAPNQIVYVFVPEGNGSVYAGAFKVTAVQQDQSTLTPNSRLRLLDVLASRPEFAEPLNLVNQAINPRPKTFDLIDEWKIGVVPIRIRTAVPPQYSMRIIQAENDLLVADERLTLEAVGYNSQVAMLDVAKKQITLRTEEITGTPALADKDIPIEFKAGYLKALEEEDEARNKALLVADDLRHRLKRTTDRFAEVRQRNAELEKSLPRPADTTTARADQ